MDNSASPIISQDGMCVFISKHMLLLLVYLVLAVSGSESEREVLLVNGTSSLTNSINDGRPVVRYGKWRIRVFLAMLAVFSATGTVS